MENVPSQSADCIAVLGPTCAWKSDVAALIACRLDGEIISCDSMQVYRQMNIGTAKPTADMRSLVPHHLIDILDIDEPYDANKFVAHAKAILADLKDKGKQAILAGGTGFYARALIYQYQMLPADRQTLQQVCREYEEDAGPQKLLRELATVADDKVIAVACRNPRKLMRAVEVLRLTGAPPPWPELKERTRTPVTGFRQFILMPEPSLQRQRIEARTRAMVRSGWIEEAEQLLGQGLLETATARQALGYGDIAAYLRGEIADRETLIKRLITRTVQYARRQRTWFRHQHPGAEILSISGPATSESICAEIMQRLNAAGKQ